MNPYPSWLNAGDNSWQMTAATLVGLMSIPALAVLYGGLVQKKWAINTVMMVFTRAAPMNLVLESVVVVRLPSGMLMTVPMAPSVSANAMYAPP